MPTVLALLAVALLVVCVIQARGRGLGFVPPPTEWELHPAWWHVPALAKIGEFCVVLPAMLLAVPLAMLFGGESVLAWSAIGLVIISEAALVFYVSRMYFRRLEKRPNNHPEPTAQAPRLI